MAMKMYLFLGPFGLMVLECVILAIIRLYAKFDYWCNRPCVRRAPRLPLSPIYLLPQEVLYHLGTQDELALADTASLALTCRSLYAILDGQALLRRLRRRGDSWADGELLHTGNQERLEFLQRFQIQFPGRVLCHQCATFHRYQRPWLCEIWEGMTASTCDEKIRGIGSGRWWFYLPFSLAQEIMNCHLYGHEYGCQLADIERVFTTTRPGLLCRRRISGRIVDNELVIKVDRSTLYDRNSASSRRDVAKLHGESADFNWLFWPSALPKLEVSNHAVDMIFECVHCEAELRYLVDPGYSQEMGEVRTTVWFNVGSCRSPLDPKWRRKFTDLMDHRPRRQFRMSPKYMKYFDDLSPQKVETKWCGIYYAYMRSCY